MRKLMMMLGFDPESGRATIDGNPVGEPIELTIRIMDGEAVVVEPFDFIGESMQTLSPSWHGEKVSKHEFVTALSNAIEALERLDKVKKSLFYGRDNGLAPALGGINVRGLPNMIQNEQRHVHGIEMTLDAIYNIIHGSIGYATESGEMLEMLRNLINGEKLDSTNILEECGDGKWYMAILLKTLGHEWGEDERRVIKKLRQRFPDAFTEYDANNRNLSAERSILEGDAVKSDNFVSDMGAAIYGIPDIDDLRTHRDAWRSALKLCADSATNDADKSYYQHELNAFDRTFELVFSGNNQSDAANQLALPIGHRDNPMPGEAQANVGSTPPFTGNARARFEAGGGGMLSGADTD